jgi:hypothetical protein
MPKPPKNLPEYATGVRVRLRANSQRCGTIVGINNRMWCAMEWDDQRTSPKMVHHYELMTPPIDGSSQAGV